MSFGNHRETFLVEKIDRDNERDAERGRLLAEAQEVVQGFMGGFRLAEERAEAADALARALAPVLTQTCGSVRAANRFSALAGSHAGTPMVGGPRR